MSPPIARVDIPPMHRSTICQIIQCPIQILAFFARSEITKGSSAYENVPCERKVECGFEPGG
jgi:hypothetical protein